MKREPYGEFKDPRNISNVDPSHVQQHSRFTLPLSKALSKSSWYGFGHTYQTMGESILFKANHNITGIC